MIQIKRIYEECSESDGYRILIDRLWPRGITKERAKIDLWSKDIAPSHDLRKWYLQNLEKVKQFKKKYIIELGSKPDSVNKIREKIQGKKNITLLYAAKEPDPIHAKVLQEILGN